MPEASDTTARTAAAALVADAVCVLVFCAIGRRSHAEGITIAGVAETAWPFLTGTAAQDSTRIQGRESKGLRSFGGIAGAHGHERGYAEYLPVPDQILDQDISPGHGILVTLDRGV